jgi:hypothetical protein
LPAQILKSAEETASLGEMFVLPPQARTIGLSKVMLVPDTVPTDIEIAKLPSLGHRSLKSGRYAPISAAR